MLRRLRQVDEEFKLSLSYTVRNLKQSKAYRTAVYISLTKTSLCIYREWVDGTGSLSLSLCVIGRVTYYMFLICMHMRTVFLKIGSHVAQDDLDLTV